MKRDLVLYAIISALALQVARLDAGPPPLIPRDVLFGNPDRAAPQISPDGQRLSYLAPLNGVLNVWVRTVGKNDDRAVTSDRWHGIVSYIWAPNNEQILYIQDKNGDQNWHLYSVNLATNDVRDLTPFEKVQARLIAAQQAVPNQILVGINKRDPQFHDVYRADLTTAELVLEARNDQGLVDWHADHNLHIRAAMRPTAAGGFELVVREDAKASWKTLTAWDPTDALYCGPISFTPDGRGLYIASSTGTNTAQLRQIDLATGKEKTLAGDRRVDVADVYIHPAKHHVQAVSFDKGRVRWKILDRSIKKDFQVLKRTRRGEFSIVDRDHGDRTWLVAFDTDDGPVSYYTYDRESNEAKFLFTNRKALENVKLARMEPIGFRARDGLFIRGYLTTPPGVPAQNLPMVLLVHGGPWLRDRWGYNERVQWLANRGYAVLQINFRGSIGFGKDFVNAATREWGGKMHDDLIDGVNWAVGKGIADPKRIAIFGESFGGYATLVGLTFTPEAFCCGVDICGWSNLITFINAVPDYVKPFEPLLWDRIGHPETDAEFLKSRSPLFNLERITKPLLIAQGGNDPWLEKSEPLKIVETLRQAGKVVEYVEYPDEGHGFTRPENRLDFFARAEKFLATHLGGRCEE